MLTSRRSPRFYLLNWFAGHDWALAYVSTEVAAAYTEAASGKP